MNKEQFWRNFCLNRELHVSGAFIYDGMRELRTLQTFDNADEVGQIVYPLAVGFERLLKIAIVLLEYQEGVDQEVFEKSPITHNHLELLRRVKARVTLNLGSQHSELLQILGKFYKSWRFIIPAVKRNGFGSLRQRSGEDAKPTPKTLRKRRLPNDRFHYRWGAGASHS